MKNLSKVVTILYFIITVVAGAFLIMFAGVDDSPGGQLIGLIVVAGAIIGVVRGIKSLKKA